MRVDVVVRTKKIGHLFPTGTVDAFDIWLELKAEDANGVPIFWSGRVEDDGKGAVEKGAHFYLAYLLDEHGNRINKRNAFHARTLLYSRQIPPGAADTVHFRMHIPEDAAGPIRLHAKLNYRKFSRYYTEFAYAGKPVAGHDRRSSAKTSTTASSISRRKMCPPGCFGQDQGPHSRSADRYAGRGHRRVADRRRATPSGSTRSLAEDYIRWNDYGIGLLLQGDLKGAEWAFQRVTEAKPDYADGWLNIARALIQEGETTAACALYQQGPRDRQQPRRASISSRP